MISITAAAISLLVAQGPATNDFESTVWQRAPVFVAKRGPTEMLVSVNMADAELARVIQSVIGQTGTNLVLLSGQNTKVTMRLTDVTVEELIRHLCAMTGLGYLKVGTTFVIANDEQLRTGYPIEYMLANPTAVPTQDPFTTELYVTNFVNAQQVTETLKDIFGDSLSILHGPSPTVPTISQQETSSVTGVQSGIIASDGLSPSRVIMIRGPRSTVDAAIALARRFDIAGPIIDIRVTIHDISNEALREIGLAWSYGDIAITETGNTGMGFGQFARSPMSFLATISALETVDAAKLLASPNISMLDGQRAYVLIGTRLNFPVIIGFTPANTPIFDRQEERVGIYLQVAASATQDGRVTLSIYPQVSTITGFLNVGGASYPQIATREAQTTLRVQSGETIIMAGMLRDEEVRSMERVPLLSDIPVLGELFKRRKTTRVSSQVIITITPTIIGANTNGQQ